MKELVGNKQCYYIFFTKWTVIRFLMFDLDAVKRGIDIHGNNHLNMMIHGVIGRVESTKLKNQKQVDISDFLK